MHSTTQPECYLGADCLSYSSVGEAQSHWFGFASMLHFILWVMENIANRTNYVQLVFLVIAFLL